jgi:mannose-6-phosphate isomerase-like protein (cupin superfamily)
MKLAIVLVGALAFCAPMFAQSHGKADVFSARDLKAKVEALAPEAKTKGSSGATLADYGSHKVQLSVRTASGGAEVHEHFDDVMIVQQGSATLVTGGTVIDPKTGADGETKGSGILGGLSRKISVGDVVTVNAGVPHQLLIPPGTIYAALVIKVREQ